MGDLRAALQGSIRRPFSSVVAVTILALGLSAGIGAFTYFNGFHALPARRVRGGSG